MNYSNYDDYMRNLIGYPNMRANISGNISASMFPCSNMEPYSDNLERMYPEVYRVVYPMVCFACDNIRTPITEEMVDMMTDDIYDRVEADGRIDISVEVRNDEETQESRQRRPRRRNRFLRDLIRILLLRELLGRRQRFPGRPF